MISATVLFGKYTSGMKATNMQKNQILNFLRAPAMKSVSMSLMKGVP